MAKAFFEIWKNTIFFTHFCYVECIRKTYRIFPNLKMPEPEHKLNKINYQNRSDRLTGC